MHTKEKLLIQAAGQGNLGAVNALIKLGANVNFRDKKSASCALDRAAARGRCTVIQRLLRAGALVDGVRLIEVDNTLSVKTRAYDYTPLMRAILSGHIGAIRILLDAGANVGTPFFNTVGSYSGHALTLAVQIIDNHDLSIDHHIAIIKALLPAADRCSLALRRDALDQMEENTRIAPNGEKIHLSSGGMARPTPTEFELELNHRKDQIADILRHYGTFQSRLNAIQFDPNNLNDEEKTFYESILDPVTGEVINDPIQVSTLSQKTYDRLTLMDYFRAQIEPNEMQLPKTMPCPLTRQDIKIDELFQIKENDTAIKNQINLFVSTQEQHYLTTSMVRENSASSSNLGMFSQNAQTARATSTFLRSSNLSPDRPCP